MFSRTRIYAWETDYGVAWFATLTIRPGLVTELAAGRDWDHQTRFPRLLAWKIGRSMLAAGYTRLA